MNPDTANLSRRMLLRLNDSTARRYHQLDILASFVSLSQTALLIFFTKPFQVNARPSGCRTAS